MIRAGKPPVFLVIRLGGQLLQFAVQLRLLFTGGKAHDLCAARLLGVEPVQRIRAIGAAALYFLIDPENRAAVSTHPAIRNVPLFCIAAQCQIAACDALDIAVAAALDGLFRSFSGVLHRFILPRGGIDPDKDLFIGKIVDQIGIEIAAVIIQASRRHGIFLLSLFFRRLPDALRKNLCTGLPVQAAGPDGQREFIVFARIAALALVIIGLRHIQRFTVGQQKHIFPIRKPCGAAFRVVAAGGITAQRMHKSGVSLDVIQHRVSVVHHAFGKIHPRRGGGDILHLLQLTDRLGSRHHKGGCLRRFTAGFRNGPGAPCKQAECRTQQCEFFLHEFTALSSSSGVKLHTPIQLLK